MAFGSESFTLPQRTAIHDYFTFSREFFLLIEHRLQEEVGISVAEHEMLLPLLECPEDSGRGMRVGALAEAAGWETSRVAHQIQRMEKRGFVSRTPDPADGRGTVIELTGLGRTLALRARQTMESTLHGVLSASTEDLVEFGKFCLNGYQRIVALRTDR